MNKNNINNNPYRHLLDKYLDTNFLDWETKQQRKEEAENKYGHLLDYAKPDNSVLELMVKMEDERIERQEQETRDRELAQQRNQMRIEVERQRERQRMEANSSFVESVLAKKDAEMKAELDRKKQERMEAEEQQKIHDRINSLMKISPESANAYVQALKQGNVI